MSSNDPITYGDDALDAVAIGRKLANLVDLSPFLLWTEAEANGFGDAFEAIAPDLVRNPRARRIQVAFAMAVAAGMPERTRLLIVVEWIALLLRRVTDDPGRVVLAQAIELAFFASNLAPDAAELAELRRLLFENECADDGGLHTAITYAASIVRSAIEAKIDDNCAGAPNEHAAYDAWCTAANVFGAIGLGLGARADEAFVECERILGGVIYCWLPLRAV